MSKKKFQPGQGQRAFEFEALNIPAEYSLDQAKLAAERRFKRIGELALIKDVTSGFRKKTGGLWIPFSQAENTAIVSPPNAQLIKERIMAKQRVKEKYQDSEISHMRVERWASYAAQQTLKERRSKYQGYHDQAQQHLIGLETGLNNNRTYSADSIMNGRWAIYWLKEYVIALKAFNTHKWIQPHWTHKRAEEMEWADSYVGKLNDDQLTEHYDEAVWNAWSRNNYWQEQTRSLDVYDPTQEPSQQPPDEAYLPWPADDYNENSF